MKLKADKIPKYHEVYMMLLNRDHIHHNMHAHEHKRLGMLDNNDNKTNFEGQRIAI